MSRAGSVLRAFAVPLHTSVLWQLNEYNSLGILLRQSIRAFNTNSENEAYTPFVGFEDDELSSWEECNPFVALHSASFPEWSQGKSVTMQFDKNQESSKYFKLALPLEHRAITTWSDDFSKSDHRNRETIGKSFEYVDAINKVAAEADEFQQHLSHASSTWLIEEISLLGISRVVYALHQGDRTAARQQLSSLLSNLTQHLSAASKELLDSSYFALAQLQIITDIDRLILDAQRNKQIGNSRSILSPQVVKTCLDRVDLLSQTKGFQSEALSIFKVVMEHLGDVDGAALAAIKLSK